MGDVVNYQCSCGLKGQALSGGGEEAAGLSYYCKKCESIHTVLSPYDDFDMDEMEVTANDPVEALLLKCGSDNLTLIDFPDKSQNMACPHCGKKLLNIVIAGSWD